MPHPQPAPSAHDWTAERVRALRPDDRHWPRYECVDGELLATPAPAWSHQRCIGLLYEQIAPYARRVGAEALFAPADVELDARTLVQPDLFVVPLVAGRKAESYADVGRLLLAVEVISPSSGRADRVVKRRRYQRERFDQYWVVDVEARLVERWRPDDDRPDQITGALTWQPNESVDPLVIDLDALFAEVTA